MKRNGQLEALIAVTKINENICGLFDTKLVTTANQIC